MGSALKGSGFRASFARVAAAAATLVVAAPGWAVVRTCGVDGVVNTATVLCAAPSGPCTASLVVLGNDIDVVAGGCTFDLGGRALRVDKTLQMTGLGFIDIVNAGDITITATGRLKARGDFVEPAGLIIRGGSILLSSSGTITLTDRSQIDVSGDAAGSVRLIAAGVTAAGVGIDLQSGSILRGHGISSSTGAGERFSDGGVLQVTALAGSVIDNADIDMGGANQAAGGDVSLQAARDISVGAVLDVSGGASDGGTLDLLAGDDIRITKTMTVESRLGGGTGGGMTLAAGADALGGVHPGGTLLVDNAPLLLNGSASETSGGDGGDFDATASGTITFTATAQVRVDAATLFDGSGGTIFIGSGDTAASAIGPLDGDISLGGTITANSGADFGTGGSLEVSTGRNLTLTAAVDMSGKDGGGDIIVDAGGSIVMSSPLRSVATNATGPGGFIDVTSGLASNSGLTVNRDVLAAGGASNGAGQSISLVGCTLTVATGVVVDGRGGVDPVSGALGGSDITLGARGLMQLGASSRYLGDPGGRVFTLHPVGQTPVIGSGVVFTTARVDSPTTVGLPGCSNCGDGIVQGAEACDDGARVDGDGCSATCTVEPGWVCSGAPSTCATVCGDGVATPNEGCDDGNTVPDDCCSNTCQPVRIGLACTSDGNVCTSDVCGATGVCEHQPTAGSCNDGNACTQTDTCQAGVCVGSNPVVCAASDQCHVAGVCAPATGVCSNPVKANGSTCNDGDACTRTDACQAGSCVGANPVVCTALDQCHVAGVCAPATGICSNPAKADGSTCSDGNACTRTDGCQAGTCVGGNPVVCTALDQCHISGVCNTVTGVCSNPNAPNGTGCDDTNVCTIRDACSVGSCIGDTHTCGDGVPQLTCGESCDDGNATDGDGCDTNCTPTACGNGVVTSGEACDDGDLSDGDGCSASCTVEPGWRCSGRPSTCSEVCGDTIVTPGEQCDDGNTISRDGCSATCRRELCAATPASGCRLPIAAQKSVITLKHRSIASSNSITWKWGQGAATTKAEFGDPVSGTSYAVCVYDEVGGTPRLRLSSTAPGGGFCDRGPCWRDKGTAFLYSRRDLFPEGLSKVTLTPGVGGAAKIMVKGKGANLAMPDLSGMGLPLRVQMLNSAGLCWEARFSAPAAKQTPDLFKDKSD